MQLKKIAANQSLLLVFLAVFLAHQTRMLSGAC
jgi:hypothetical protein